jgi:hypothetical protein
MTYHNDASYSSINRAKSKLNLGSASRFINFVRQEERENKYLNDQPAITHSQNVYESLDTDE